MIGTVLVIALATAVGWWAWEKSQRKTRQVPGGYQPDVHLPYEEEFELYHNALSLCSKKARVCMAELGLAHRSHHIDLIETGSYENLSRRFLAVNPAATVPVLVHKGHPIYESHDQIRYAADHAPDTSPKLVPDDPEQQAVMQTWIDCASIMGDPMAEGHRSAGNAVPGLTVALFAGMIDDIPWPKIMEGLLFHIDRRRPLIFMALKARGLAKLHTIGPFMKIVARSRDHMNAHLDRLEAQLQQSGGPWILGEAFSLADVSWVVIFERLLETDYIHVFLDGQRRPAVSTYWEALKARPSYREALTDHTHPTVTRGLERLRAAKAADAKLRTALEGV
jgi:glutathione S-transferase